MDVRSLGERWLYLYFSFFNGRILKFDPSNGDSLSLVGEEIKRGFTTAVLGNDGYIYGISVNRIVKISLTNYSIPYRPLASLP